MNEKVDDRLWARESMCYMASGAGPSVGSGAEPAKVEASGQGAFAHRS